MSAERGIGAPVSNGRAQEVRRLQLGEIYYFLYYRTRSPEVQVLAVQGRRQGEEHRHRRELAAWFSVSGRLFLIW